MILTATIAWQSDSSQFRRMRLTIHPIFRVSLFGKFEGGTPMLVYANHLTLEGSGAPDAIFRAVGGWLKEQMGRGLHPIKLKSDGKHEGKKRDGTLSTLRIHAASEDGIEYYAWVLKHSDKEDRDRQWITEIGAKLGNEKLEISFVVRTEDMSARVEPPSVSRPRVIQYVVGNIKKADDANFSEKPIPVYKTKEIGEDSYSYRALLVDIEKEDRRYPIVLVSPTTEGEYLLNTDYLQEKLVGLAQVVRIIPDFNFDEMEDVLGKYRSAYAGAVNILYTPNRFGYHRIRFCSSDNISGWGDKQEERASEILSLVTHETNRSYFHLRIRPEKIAQRSIYQRSENLLSKLTEKTADVDKYKEVIKTYKGMVYNIDKEVDGLNSDMKSKDREINDLKDENHKKDSYIEHLKDRLKNENIDQIMPDNMDFIIEILRKEKLTPLECLEMIEKHHGDKCIILDSAKDSAGDSVFDGGRRLISQLIRLVTRYREFLVNGGSDSEARKKFFGSKEISAKESESTKKNRKLAEKRTFRYEGEDILMERHLKIANVGDKTKTIRTYFHWDGKKKMIVIGYCGVHLPVSKKKK